MDILSHALYGATFCSKSGLAGGLRGSETKRILTDKTVWWAAFFGILPDILSMGAPFLVWLFLGSGNFFMDFDAEGVVAYRYAHSLLVSLLFAGLLWLYKRPLGVPALGWTVHIIADAFTHDLGKFKTTLFYPLTEWSPGGWAFWQHWWVIPSYWFLLCAIWLFIVIVRRHVKNSRRNE